MGEALQGVRVLEEFVDTPAGWILWVSLRAARLWAAVAPEVRGELFQPGAARKRMAELRDTELEPALEKPLRVIARVLRRDASISPEALAAACREVSHWADAQGKLGTALDYMQAAALATPDDAHAAYDVGRLARRRAEYARADSWFRHAIALARQNADWVAYALAFIGLGNLYLQRGNFPAARKSFARALKLARRHQLRETEAMACHDLFVIADQSNQPAEAEVFAAAALHAYGTGHPKLPYLAHDVASSWINQGQFARALPVLRTVLPHVRGRGDVLITLGNLARAGGAVGDATAFHEAWTEAWERLEQDEGREGTAQALLDLARGAASLGEWARADVAAARALEIAVAREEAQVRISAEAVRESVRNGRLARTPRKPPVPPAEDLDPLASEFVSSLEGVAVSSV
jgi:tetratricopeptide (TPR) repeat protein